MSRRARSRASGQSSSRYSEETQPEADVCSRWHYRFSESPACLAPLGIEDSELKQGATIRHSDYVFASIQKCAKHKGTSETCPELKHVFRGSDFGPRECIFCPGWIPYEERKNPDSGWKPDSKPPKCFRIFSETEIEDLEYLEDHPEIPAAAVGTTEYLDSPLDVQVGESFMARRVFEHDDEVNREDKITVFGVWLTLRCLRKCEDHENTDSQCGNGDAILRNCIPLEDCKDCQDAIDNKPKNKQRTTLFVEGYNPYACPPAEPSPPS